MSKSAWSDAVGPYCRSKLLAEQYAFHLAGKGLPVVVANPTMPVGPGDRGLSPPTRLIVDFCGGHLPATMDCTLNLIDVRDVALGSALRRWSGPSPGGATCWATATLRWRFARLAVRTHRRPRAALASPLLSRYRRSLDERTDRGPSDRTNAQSHSHRRATGEKDHAF